MKVPPGTVPTVGVVAYGAGDIANSMTFSTIGMFLLVYYTDVAGIPAAAAGTVLLLGGLFNAITDVFAGRAADQNTRLRMGKFRPFLLLGAAPLMLSALVFHVPSLDPAGKLIYAYVSYFAFCLAYSLVNVPYGALAGALTHAPRGRARLASARTVGGLCTGAFLGIVIAPQFESGADMQGIMTFLTVGFAIVGTLLYLFTALATREQIPQSTPKLSFRQAVTVLRGNGPLMVLCVSSLLFMTSNVVTNTAKLFYLRDIFDRLDLFAVVAAAQVVITLGAATVMPRLVHRWGKRTVYVFGGVAGATGGILVFAAPDGSVWLALTGIVLSLLGSAVISMLMWALVADTVEFGEWRSGHRTDGINYALLSSTRKIGIALGGALAAFALAWGGYEAGAAAQSAQAELGIRIAAGLAPAVLLLLALAAMRWYKLSDAAHAELVLEIEDRRARQ